MNINALNHIQTESVDDYRNGENIGNNKLVVADFNQLKCNASCTKDHNFMKLCRKNCSFKIDDKIILDEIAFSG